MSGYPAKLLYVNLLLILVGDDFTTAPVDANDYFTVLIAEVLKIRSKIAQCNCTAMVGTDIVAEAKLKFMLVDEESV